MQPGLMALPQVLAVLRVGKMHVVFLSKLVVVCGVAAVTSMRLDVIGIVRVFVLKIEKAQVVVNAPSAGLETIAISAPGIGQEKNAMSVSLTTLEKTVKAAFLTGRAKIVMFVAGAG